MLGLNAVCLFIKYVIKPQGGRTGHSANYSAIIEKVSSISAGKVTAAQSGWAKRPGRSDYARSDVNVV